MDNKIKEILNKYKVKVRWKNQDLNNPFMTTKQKYITDKLETICILYNLKYKYIPSKTRLNYFSILN